jgi:archaellum biogenesis ATPase FlaH
MSEKGSVFQKGGGGTNFEQHVQTAFLTTLIIRGNAPCLNANEIIEVAFQTTNRGYQTDDLLVVAKTSVGIHRLLIQVKTNITISESDEIFQKVIEDFWIDFNNTIRFDKGKDKIVLIKSVLTKDERNHLKPLLNWAKTHNTTNDFISEVKRVGLKENRLNIFRECLKKANDNIYLTDIEIWEFLRCFDILEYDFLNESSMDETYFLNLIKLSKSSNSSLNDKEIWDSILAYASKLNKDGGSVSIDSIQKEPLYQNFNYEKINPFFKNVEKLKSDGEVIKENIVTIIGEVHIDRKNISQSIIESINANRITIVTGKPGFGKSSEIKNVIEKEYFNDSVFIFRAEQFNMPHLSNVFSSQGVNEKLVDIFSCIALIPNKIIFIDSLEKLLESDPEYAFKQFLSLLKNYPDIKIVGACRKYAVDLVTLKFDINKSELNIIEVPPLTTSEIESIVTQYPKISDVLKNSKIRKVLESLKYLDFLIKSSTKKIEDYANITEIQLKESLWNGLVEDYLKTIDGLPSKREKAFMEIAINRAKGMKLFVTPSDSIDTEAIRLLENDGIIFQENQNHRYSPAHDILEDWALIRYVSAIYENFPTPIEFYNNLGNEPAIRRAFRLWIEDYLIDDSFKINQLIRDSIFNNSIDNYWADEILIAVFKSENSSSFFVNFKQDLLANDCNLLNNCIHLIKTTCKESKWINGETYLLIPIGSGWSAIMQFISSHIEEMDSMRSSIFNLIQVWELRITYNNDEIDSVEKLAVKNIVCHFITQIESKDKFWEKDARYHRDTYPTLIALLYHLADIAQIEISNLINNASNYRYIKGEWELDSFYELVIERALLGVRNLKLIQELPELIIKTAWKSWKLNLKDEIDEHDSVFGKSFRSNRLSTEKCWGINDKHQFFPPSIFKTPIFNLLWENPKLTLEFIVEFVNYSVDFYANADCDYKHEIYQINVELNDGTIIKQWANEELWLAFRGLSVTHYGLECILIALEKYLLALANSKTMDSRNRINSHFGYLIKNSNNVAIMSVLASIAMAHPEEIQEEVLPIFSIKEFYEWDFTRVFKENSALAIYDQRIPFAQQERIEFNKLPHRKKYSRGLADFIVQYQFNICILNDKIYRIFDKMNSNIPKDDIFGRKLLTEIDVRNWEVQEYDSDLGGFSIEPNYEEDVTEMVKSGREYNQSINNSFTYSNKIEKALKSVEKLLFDEWEEYHNYYCQNEASFSIYDKPVTLAVVGLRDFSIKLTTKQKDWCINCLVKTIASVCESNFNPFDFMREGSRFNLREKEIALTSFHYIFNVLEEEEEKSGILELLLYVMICPFHRTDLEVITKYIRTIFHEQYPEETRIVWFGVVKYAQYKVSNNYMYDDPDRQKISSEREKELEFIRDIINRKEIILDISTINLENSKKYILMNAMLITPVECKEEIYQEFIMKCILLFTDYIQSSKHRGRDRTSYDIFGEMDYNVKMYISEVILSSESKFSKQLLDMLLDPIYSEEYDIIRQNRNHFEFVSEIMKIIITTLDKIIANSNDQIYNNQLIDNFWNIWDYFFEKIKKSERKFLSSTLLLDIEWYKDSTDWTPLHNKKEYYYQIIKQLGSNQTESIINVFSTVGEKQFLPDGLRWLVEIYKNNDSSIKSLTHNSAERLIERLFYNHITIIKNNKTLIQDFIWLLSKMVDLGSSNAYFFLENVITYKNNK